RDEDAAGLVERERRGLARGGDGRRQGFVVLAVEHRERELKAVSDRERQKCVAGRELGEQLLDAIEGRDPLVFVEDVDARDVVERRVPRRPGGLAVQLLEELEAAAVLAPGERDAADLARLPRRRVGIEGAVQLGAQKVSSFAIHAASIPAAGVAGSLS